MTPLRSWALPAVVALAAAACGRSSEDTTRGAPPPPVASARPGACAGGGGPLGDPVSAPLFPATFDSFCVDPHAEIRTYGEQGKLDMDAVCTTAFDGECAVYTQMGLKRLVSLRYVDGAGDGSTVDVYLSRFADAAGAYAMFTKRVVADGDPAEPTTPKPLAAGGAGAIGTGRAYVWKDRYLAELQYSNEQETPEALARSSSKALTSLGVAIGQKLPGAPDLPPAAAVLPTDHRIANGVQLVLKDALGVTGLGPLAVGYHADGAVRYRTVAFVGADDAKALEAWKLLRGRPGALPVAGAGLGDEAVAVTLLPPPPNGAHRDYVFARKGAYVVGVGDEELVGATPGEKTSPTRLSREEKVGKLKAWVAALPAARAPAPKK